MFLLLSVKQQYHYAKILPICEYILFLVGEGRQVFSVESLALLELTEIYLCLRFFLYLPPSRPPPRSSSPSGAPRAARKIKEIDFCEFEVSVKSPLWLLKEKVDRGCSGLYN